MSYSDDNAIEYKGLTIRISQEEDFDCNPRIEYGNAARMYCEHRRYSLGDVDSKGRQKFDAPWQHTIDPRDPDGEYYGNEHAFDWAIAAGAEMLPLYLMDHSGISISTGSFNDPWDSGMVGYIYMTREMIITECAFTGKRDSAGMSIRNKSNRITKKMRAKAREMMRQEVETYNQYLTGDVWYYLVENADGDTVDSCGGMFGYDYCLNEARQAIDSLPVQLSIMPAEVPAVAVPAEVR